MAPDFAALYPGYASMAGKKNYSLALFLNNTAPK